MNKEKSTCQSPGGYEPGLGRFEEQNQESWYMTEQDPRLFIAMSVESIGPARGEVIFDEETKKSELRFSATALRKKLAGNMSVNYGNQLLPLQERVVDALTNQKQFAKTFGIQMNQTVVLYPQHDFGYGMSLSVVDSVPRPYDIDEPAILHERSDFVLTHDPERVLMVRPADCPILIIKGLDAEGDFLALVHMPWKGVASNHVGNMFAHFKSIGVDLDSLRIYMSAGAQPESYTYNDANNPLEAHADVPDLDKLFVDIREVDGQYSFRIDVQGYLVDRLREGGIADYQMFIDDSDTASMESGYSSHSRSKKAENQAALLGVPVPSGLTNTRDLILASLSDHRPVRREIDP